MPGAHEGEAKPEKEGDEKLPSTGAHAKPAK